MLLDTVVRARVDKKTKEEAEAVLAEIGLTLSDAVRLMMIRIAREKAMRLSFMTVKSIQAKNKI